MVLLKADMKAKFLYFSMCMSVNKLVCKCQIKFRGKNKKKFMPFLAYKLYKQPKNAALPELCLLGKI